MSKAIAGAAEIGAAVGLTALAAFTAGGSLLAIPAVLQGGFGPALIALAMSGASMEAGAIAGALASNRGMGITTRQPACFRQIVRGEQRIPGNIVYLSTTGGTRRQYNLVIVLSTHEIDSIPNLYLDGRQVFWQAGSHGNSTRNGVNFGGTADPGQFIGPNGVKYTFGSEVFCRAYYGDQDAVTGLCEDLVANDPAWTSTPSSLNAARARATWNGRNGIDGEIDSIDVVVGGIGYTDSTDAFITIFDQSGTGSGATAVATVVSGVVTAITVTSPGAGYTNPQVTIAPPSGSTGIQTPYGGGCARVYLKLEADSGTFPQFPEIRFTVRGKNDIWDPRTGERGYTSNWALQVADAITDPLWGLGDDTVNQDQLIASANVCDELVQCAAGFEARYALHWHYDTSVAPGDVIGQMMDGAAGRYARIGGEWFIWPAYYQGTSFSFNADALVGGIQWNPKRALSELCNRITGTYTAPNFPYNVAGNMYDSNGYWNGEMQNNFPFAFQPASYPMYACDERHGYGAGVDVYLQEDGGIYLPREVGQQCLLSISQAQRVAKIMLLRNRQQGSGTFPMSLAAFQMQPLDVMHFSMQLDATTSWVNKTLEITGPYKFRYVPPQGDDGPYCYVEVPVQETDPSVYAWNPAEELTPYDVPAFALSAASYIVEPPTSLIALSNLSTALVAPDGTLTPRIELDWVQPADTYVTNGGAIEIQMCAHGTAAWESLPLLGGQTTTTYIGGVVSGQSYDLRARALRASGAQSVWVELDNVVCGAQSSATNYAAVAPVGTLIAITSAPTVAGILVMPFPAHIPGFTASCLPGGSAWLAGLSPQQFYYVYYYDPAFAGGAITPVATLNPADFVGKPGYFLIGSVLTLPWIGARYTPSNFTSLGQCAVTWGSDAYDNNLGTWAIVMGINNMFWVGGAWGEVLFSGFAAATSVSGQSLYVNGAAIQLYSLGTSWAITASLGGGQKPSGQLGALNARGAWAASTAYAVWNTFTQGGNTYLVVMGYTSDGTFGAADIANTCVLLASGTGAVAQQSYAAALPAGLALSTVTVDVTVNAPPPPDPVGDPVEGIYVYVYEIYVQ